MFINVINLLNKKIYKLRYIIKDMIKTLLVQFKTEEEQNLLKAWKEKRVRGHGSLRKNILLLMENDLKEENRQDFRTAHNNTIKKIHIPDLQV